MIIKMVNEFNLLHAQTRCRSVHAREFTAGHKNCGKSGLGRQAPGLSRAEGPDLLLAKPRVRLLSHLMIN